MRIDVQSLTNEFTLPLDVVQEKLEAELSLQGYMKKVSHTIESFNRSVDGDTDISEMPKGTALMMETTESVESFFSEIVERELEKRRKSRFYDQLVAPTMTRFLKDDMKAKESKFYTRRYENPMGLIPYFISRELCRLMVVGEAFATESARRVADQIHRAYIGFEQASDDELISVLQVMRTYMVSTQNKYYKETKFHSAVIFTFKEEYKTLEVDEFDLVTTIQGDFATFKPMLVEPKKHSNLLDNDGGYITLDSPILKRPEFGIVRQVPFKKNQFFDVLNSLQSTKFQINTEFFGWLKECKHPEVQKYFNNDLLKVQRKAAKDTKIIKRKIGALSKKVKELRYNLNDDIDFVKKENIARQIQNNSEEIELLNIEHDSIKSHTGKVIGWSETLSDIDFYSNFDCFYHPLFCDNRGRIYTYNTSLSFQGSSLGKSVIQTHHKERMSPEGLQNVYELLGGMVDGLSKKKREVRIKHIEDNIDSIFKVITHEDYSFVDTIDSDELLCSLSLMFTVYKHLTDENYETGILAYIDSTSSAIQIQALAQHCKQAAYLTNLLPNETDSLPDAYKEVANISQKMVKEISLNTDDDLKANLISFLEEYSPEDLAFINTINYEE